MIRKLFAAAAAAAILAVPASTASAATYADQFAGIELPPVSSTLGTFAGVATGQLPGGWYAQIAHEPLAASGSVAITGGSFRLYTLDGRTVSGSVVAGPGSTITVLNPGAGCTNQTYGVSVVLTNGAFSGRLTHYRASIFGRCVTYSATVVGSGTIQA